MTQQLGGSWWWWPPGRRKMGWPARGWWGACWAPELGNWNWWQSWAPTIGGAGAWRRYWGAGPWGGGTTGNW